MSTDRPRSKRWRGSLVRVGLTVVICLVATSAIYVRNVMKSRATPPLPLPNPNAYDDLVRAGKLVQGTVPNEGKLKEANPEELRAWIEKNRDSLSIARESLKKPSRVPLIYSADITEHLDRGRACRMLARLIAAEGELALKENRPSDASRSFLDLARLGPAMGRGGLLIDVLTGVAIETVGLDGLNRVRNELKANELRAAIPILLESDKSRETFAAVRNIEDYRAEQSVSYSTRLMLKITGAEARLRAPSDKAAALALQRVQTTLRQLVVDMASQLYVIDHKTDPKDPSELVPAYLPEILKDPATGEPIMGAK